MYYSSVHVTYYCYQYQAETRSLLLVFQGSQFGLKIRLERFSIECQK